MKIQYLIIALAVLTIGTAFQFRSDIFPSEKTASSETVDATLEWETSYKAALQKAQKENKKVLINFTGSDWCGWCIKLDREVFSKETFIEYADDNLVCLKLDFPRRKSLDPELQKQNKVLAAKFGIRGFPTIFILDPSEKVLLRTGYQRGGAEGYIQHLDPYVNRS